MCKNVWLLEPHFWFCLVLTVFCSCLPVFDRYVCDECTLKMHFWSGLNDELLQIMLMGNDNGSLFEYIEYALYVAGSPLIVEEEARSEPAILVPTLPAQNSPLDYTEPIPEPSQPLLYCMGMTPEPTADRET